MADEQVLDVKAWGEFACFTRPEMKVERVSYPVMTPSAARGVLSAIFWKPEFEWRVTEIHVLRPIRHFSLVRNEVNSRASARTAAGWAEDGGGYYTQEDRAQRHTLALRDVAYLIRARQVLAPHARDKHPKKYSEQFERRVRKGQSFSPPYLGCREFTAAFGPPAGDEKPISVTDDLGRMLFDLSYDDEGNGTPHFFAARLENGVLRVPQELYEEHRSWEAA